MNFKLDYKLQMCSHDIMPYSNNLTITDYLYTVVQAVAFACKSATLDLAFYPS